MVFEESGFCAFLGRSPRVASALRSEVQPPSSAPLWPRPKRWTVGRVWRAPLVSPHRARHLGSRHARAVASRKSGEVL